MLAGAVIVAALVLLVGRWSAALYTDYLWYLSLGARDVWRAKVATTTVLTAASFVVVALFAFVNFYAVRQSVVSLVLPRRIANIEIGEEVPGKYLFLAVLVMSALVAALLTFPADQWHQALLAHMGRPFGETDPYFGADLGFFVYWLPFETAVHYWAIVVLVSIIVVVILLYALTPSLRWERGTLHVSAYVRRHFTMLGAVLLLILAWSYRLGMYRLLAYGGGNGGVFTVVDHHVIVPATLLLSVVTMCAAIVVAWAGWTGQMRLAFGAVTTVILLSLVSRTIAPLVVRRSLDPGTQQEAAYLSTRLTFTRRAYGVFRMRAETLGTGFTTAAEAASKVAVWDAATLSRAAERLRRVRVVGDGAAWQTTPSGMAALLVEHGSDAAPDSRDVWGIDRFDPAASDERGLPLRTPGSALASYDLVVGEPAVYDSAPSYSVLSDSLKQLAGVEMVSTRSRLMHAWSLQNFRLLFGEIAADRPVMVRRRDVRERVEALVPFFVQGGEVVPLVAADSLYWVLELYSSASHYPLAQRFTVLGEERGYFQHAATALVHAASGRVRIVIDANPDPVAVSWLNYLPQLFKPPVMPAAVRAMLPPLTDAARTQALAFAAAGMLGQTLEVRHFALSDGADSSASREPERAVIPTIGGVAAVWPLLDSTERVRGVIAASGGAVRVTSWIPMASDGARWVSVLDRLRASDTLLHESGTIRTPVRVLPAAGRPLYVQPTFQLRPGYAPALTRVAAVQGDSVHAAATLAVALGATSRGATAQPSSTPDLRLRADSLYRVMREALGRGDWAAFGRAFDALGLALRVTSP
ncbi:MAG: hypothetical protein JWL61_1804 [Gemmatimonadetes bacterium]|nr:hypothetical protein [Gemmatimonadota bacterium]